MKLFGDQLERDAKVTKKDVANVEYMDIGSKLETYAPVEKKIQFLTRMMQKREKFLKDQAKKDEEKLKTIRNVMKIGSIACRVIPFGQPALGAIGSTAFEMSAACMTYASGKEVNWEKAVDFSRVGNYHTYRKQKNDLTKGVKFAARTLASGEQGMANVYKSKSNYS